MTFGVPFIFDSEQRQPFAVATANMRQNRKAHQPQTAIQCIEQINKESNTPNMQNEGDVGATYEVQTTDEGTAQFEGNPLTIFKHDVIEFSAHHHGDIGAVDEVNGSRHLGA